jgi:hypothetical protein
VRLRREGGRACRRAGQAGERCCRC